MTGKSDKIYSVLEARIRQLMFMIENLEKERNSLQEELSNEKSKYIELEKQKEELFSRYVNLKIAKTFSPDTADFKDGKARLNKLVREIDKCIALLNE